MIDTDRIAAERAAVHAAYVELVRRRDINAVDLPVHFATVTRPREVFADPKTAKAAEMVGKCGRTTSVSIVIEPHDGELPTSLADFGFSAPLRSMFLAATTEADTHRMTVGAGR